MCTRETKDKIIAFNDRKSKCQMYFLNSTQRILVTVEVDGCAITSGRRCDHLLVDKDNKSEYFVELKGSKIKHACDQIEESIKKLGNAEYIKHSFIISTCCPMISTEIQKQKLHFKKNLNSSLIIKRIKYEHEI